MTSDGVLDAPLYSSPFELIIVFYGRLCVPCRHATEWAQLLAARQWVFIGDWLKRYCIVAAQHYGGIPENH